MNDLNSQARAIVEAARDADEPSPADRARIKHAILVQVAAGVVASTAAAGTLTVGMSLGMKIGLLVLSVSLVGGGAVGVVHWQGKHRTASLTTPMARPTAIKREALPAATPVVAPSSAIAPVQTESKVRQPDKPRKLVAQGGADRTSPEDPLNAEVAVLGRAREELRLGRPAQALEALLEYDRRFGKGVLGEERQAIAAIAACQVHPGPSARAQAQAFMHSTPKSPLLDRVRAACLTPTR